MIKRQNIDFVLGAYAVTLMSMLLFLYRNSAVLNYIRYFYVIFMVLITIMHKVIYKNKVVLIIVGAFLFHTILFGFVITPETALASVIFDNVKEVIVLWLFVVSTAHYIYSKNLKREFLLVSQFCVSLFMNFCYLKNFNGIAPIKFIGGLFGTNTRVRFTFGLSATNRAAYLAVASIILTIMVLKEKYWIKIGKKIDFYKLFLFASLVIGVLVILSTQTRGALLSTILFLIINLLADLRKVKKFVAMHNRFRLLSLLSMSLLAVFALYFYYILNKSSRSGYLAMSLNAYKKLANRWCGLGYVPFSAFLSNTMRWGTTALDCYYVYIICTTGIIGTVIIFAALFYTFICLTKIYLCGYTDKLGTSSIVIYIVLLFVGFSETMVVAPWVPYNYVYWILFLLVLMEAPRYKAETIASLELERG